VLSKQDIEDTLSKTLLPAPSVIYYFTNAEISLKDRPNTLVRGIQKSGADAIYLNAKSPKSTVLHETIHNVGITNEQTTRLLTRILYARQTFGIIPKLRRKNVQYTEVPVSEEEKLSVLHDMGLYPENASTSDVKLVKLVLVE